MDYFSFSLELELERLKFVFEVLCMDKDLLVTLNFRVAVGILGEKRRIVLVVERGGNLLQS